MPKKHIANYLKATGKDEHDVFLCEWCGSNCMVQFHHLKLKSQGVDDSFENIMALCNVCHDKAHFKRLPNLFYDELKKKHMKLVNNLT